MNERPEREQNREERRMSSPDRRRIIVALTLAAALLVLLIVLTASLASRWKTGGLEINLPKLSLELPKLTSLRPSPAPTEPPAGPTEDADEIRYSDRFTTVVRRNGEDGRLLDSVAVYENGVEAPRQEYRFLYENGAVSKVQTYFDGEPAYSREFSYDREGTISRVVFRPAEGEESVQAESGADGLCYVVRSAAGEFLSLNDADAPSWTSDFWSGHAIADISDGELSGDYRSFSVDAFAFFDREYFGETFFLYLDEYGRLQTLYVDFDVPEGTRSRIYGEDMVYEGWDEELEEDGISTYNVYSPEGEQIYSYSWEPGE